MSVDRADSTNASPKHHNPGRTLEQRRLATSAWTEQAVDCSENDDGVHWMQANRLGGNKEKASDGKKEGKERTGETDE